MLTHRTQEAGGGQLVSVIIPCYNQAHFLGEAIESVLAQTYSHREIIIVDDGSPDNTAEVATRYPCVRYIRQQNQGLSAARNTGLRASQGRYLVFLDADDRLLPDALAAGLEHLGEHPECAFVYGWYRYIAVDGSPLPTPALPRVEGNHYLALLHDNNYIGMHATVMYRRCVFESVSGFDTSLKAVEDYELYLRIARTFPIHGHNKVIAEYRAHHNSMSCNSELMLKSARAVIRSEWAYVRGNRQYEEAYKIGERSWRDYYSNHLVAEIQTHLRARGRWTRVIRGMLVLLRFHPRRAVEAASKIIRSIRYRPREKGRNLYTRLR